MQPRTRERSSLTQAAGLRRGIGAVLVLLGLVAVVAATYSAYRSAEKLATWVRHPAQIVGLADPAWVEVEVATGSVETIPDPNIPEYATPYEDGNSRLLVARRPYAVYRLWSSPEILQDPSAPDSLELLSWVGLLTPVVAPLLLIPFLLGLWQAVRAGHWGEDVTRRSAGTAPSGDAREAGRSSRPQLPSGLLAAVRWRRSERDRWAPTPARLARRRSAGATQAPLREAPGSLRGAVFFCGVLALVALSVAPAGLGARSLTDLLVGGLLLLIAALIALVVHAMIEIRTRAVTWNDEGIQDTTFFRVRRIPWSEVGSLELINVNADLQRRWARPSRTRGRRPDTIEKYLLADHSGRVMLRLDPRMGPASALQGLRAAVATRLGHDSDRGVVDRRAEAAVHTRSMHGGPALSPERLSQLDAERIRMRRRFASSDRIMVLGLTALMLPFLLGTGYACWKTLSYLLLAEQAEGTVVEISNESAPSLIVEYETVDGEIRREESGGSDFYSDFAVGDSIGVMYRREDPEAVRLDLFLENWLGPILLGAVTAMLLLSVILLSGILDRR